MVATLALAGTGVLTAAGAAQAAGSLPCDIYAAAGTPCVAAHSTMRALYSAYNGPLYQVSRASDGADGRTSACWPPAATPTPPQQDSFCAGTTCSITEFYDQSAAAQRPDHRGPRAARPGPDVGANATALPVTAGGHKVYGVYISAGTGYRDNGDAGRRGQRPARGHVHGRQRHPRQLRLLLRLRQRRGQQRRHRQRPHGRRQPRHHLLLRAVHRHRAVGRGRPGERPVPGRQRLQHGQPRQRQRRSSPRC